jgi:hypothetical protein
VSPQDSTGKPKREKSHTQKPAKARFTPQQEA